MEREELHELWDEIEITDKARAEGCARIRKFDEDSWFLITPSDRFWDAMSTEVSLSEMEAYNDRIRKHNANVESENARKLVKPRVCEFVLSPINFSVPVSIVDDWWSATSKRPSLGVYVLLLEQIQIEERIEAIAAKIHNSPLSICSDGRLLWEDQIAVKLKPEGRRGLAANFVDGKSGSLSNFRIEDLLNTLFELGILTSSASLKRKRM